MMSSEQRTWETIKQRYLHEVSKALSSVRHPRSRTVLDDVRSHLDKRYEELPPDRRTPENLQAIITEMGPASDYADLLGPQKAPRRGVSMRSLAVAGPVALVALFAMVLGARAVMLRSGQDRPVTLVQSAEYRSDSQFEDDPAVIGAWRSIDLVDSVGQFVPGKKTSDRELWLNHLIFEPGGQIQGAIFAWTKGLVLCDHEKTAFRYQIKRVKDADYLFFEWMGDDARSRGGLIPRYYVMERVAVEALQNQAMVGQTAELPVASYVDENGRIVDKVDRPLVDDPNVRGYWQSVDFVADVCDFVPGQKRFGGDLFLKELYMLPEGNTNWAFTWTAGLILHRGDKTASRYVIETRDGETYMFLEWKSGDYTIRHQRPSYYVLKKGPDRPYVETRVTDKIDYPFVDDPNVVGTWKAVDFVAKPDDFRPSRKSWRGGELYLKELVFLPEGKTPRSWLTWTKGLVLHQGDRTASQYLIREVDG